MKRIFLYTSALIVSVALGYIILMMKPDLKKQLISVDTEYSYVMDSDMVGTFLCYTSDQKHPITDQANYMRIILYDQNDDTQIELSLNDVAIGHEEYYLKTSYFRLLITFDLPLMNQDFIIDDAYLRIELIDQASYDIRLGRVSFYYDRLGENSLNWTVLEGLKKANDLTSRIYEITVTYEGTTEDIDKIDVGTKGDVTFRFDHQQIIITIETKDYLLYDVPIIISYHDGGRQVIPNFRYMIDYVILKESGPMINVYTLD